VLPRTETIARHHEQGAAVIFARFTSAAMPFSVQGRQGNVNHIQLVRLVVPNVAPAK
jgi:hypothetical protein